MRLLNLNPYPILFLPENSTGVRDRGAFQVCSLYEKNYTFARLRLFFMDKEAAARRPLYRMFNEVPGRYDIMNRILTLGQDEKWRKKAVDLCLGEQPDEVLDICTGTADLALRIARTTDRPIKITASDFSQPMLEVAASKATKLNGQKVDFVLADTADLPFETGRFDVTTIGFAFRNLTYRNKFTPQYLSEI
ncbi:MAG TPA: class I SAM-dependent methyltransferase, partial [Bacteroidales bacterium]|nr:class I SAM-dependent methyltransferase [Bacteroidales bacterium]